MTIEKIVDYVLHTPHNTNKAILVAMLESLIRENGGNNCEGCDHPDCPNNPNLPKDKLFDGGSVLYSGGDLNLDGIIDLIYDGGMEA
jgi:hypothetical protein